MLYKKKGAPQEAALPFPPMSRTPFRPNGHRPATCCPNPSPPVRRKTAAFSGGQNGILLPAKESAINQKRTRTQRNEITASAVPVRGNTSEKCFMPLGQTGITPLRSGTATPSRCGFDCQKGIFFFELTGVLKRHRHAGGFYSPKKVFCGASFTTQIPSKGTGAQRQASAITAHRCHGWPRPRRRPCERWHNAR